MASRPASAAFLHRAPRHWGSPKGKRVAKSCFQYRSLASSLSPTRYDGGWREQAQVGSTRRGRGACAALPQPRGHRGEAASSGGATRGELLQSPTRHCARGEAFERLVACFAILLSLKAPQGRWRRARRQGEASTPTPCRDALSHTHPVSPLTPCLARRCCGGAAGPAAGAAAGRAAPRRRPALAPPRRSGS